MLQGSSCQNADKREQYVVSGQQDLYAKNQPIPFFDWSLSRDLWNSFYVSQNKNITTYSVIQGINGDVIFETPSVGYPLPRDTQLTNPLQVVGGANTTGTIAQAEPNGLFTGTHTDATIIFALNSDATVSPVYTELKVTTFPFPVKWDSVNKRFVRTTDKSNINLVVREAKPKQDK